MPWALWAATQPIACERFGKTWPGRHSRLRSKKNLQEPYTIADEAEDTSNQFAYKITGTLTNNTDKEKSYIQIEYVLYDADGNQVGTALANTNHLKAGGSWKFEALGTDVSRSGRQLGAFGRKRFLACCMHWGR